MPRIDHCGRELRLTFCTNVLPGTDVAAILGNLDRIVPAVRAQTLGDAAGSPFGLGLWIPASAAFELDCDRGRARAFGEALTQRGLEPFTLNGFPFGDFHQARVKEQVYRPTWADPERLRYTLALGRLLAAWVGSDETGSISTLPLGYKPWGEAPDFKEACARQLLELAAEWDRLWRQTGRHLVLGLEPEPACTLETTAEAIDFFQRYLLSAAAMRTLHSFGVGYARAEDVVRGHLGLCFDACHQAVEFEAMEESLDHIDRAGITIAKLQISSALDIERPGASSELLATLARFAEPRYLHQVGRPPRDASSGSRAAPTASGAAVIATDLETLLARPDSAWLAADRWRVHFHVPIHRATVSGLGTTQAELLRCLRHVLAHDRTRHLEVETYTWGVLPQEQLDEPALCAGLAAELRWVRERIDDVRAAARR